MRTYAAYLRKSRAEEGEDLAVVLARHKAKLQETAIKLGIGIVDYYEEVVSGDSVSSRPQMLALLDAVADEQYYAVLCMDIDRLGRGDMQDQGLILSAFRRSETKIITPDKTYDLQNDEDETMTEFKAFFARQEYKMIRKRMRRGTIACLQEGGYVANAPYGYEQCKINKKPSLRIIPEEAEIVRYIFRRYTSGVGANNIAHEINALGSVPRRNDAWSASSVRYLLRNPVYTGKTVFNRMRHIKKGAHGADRNICRANPTEKWLVAEGLHEAIIPQEVFDRAQEIRRGRYVPSQQDGVVHNQFAGIFRCSKCGRNMQTMAHCKGGPHLYCMTTGCCAMAKESYVEEALLDALEKRLNDLKVHPSNDHAEAIDATRRTIATLETELSKNASKKSRLYTFLEDGTYDRATFMERMELAEKEGQNLQSRLAAARAQLEVIQNANAKALQSAIETTLSLWPESGPAARNALLKTVLDVSEYTKEKKTKPRDFFLTLNYRFS